MNLIIPEAPIGFDASTPPDMLTGRAPSKAGRSAEEVRQVAELVLG